MKRPRNLTNYYITPTHDFKVYVKDHAEKYWHNDTAFNWEQNVCANLTNNLQQLDRQAYEKIARMSLPILQQEIAEKIDLLRQQGLPSNPDALKDIAESLPAHQPLIQQALDILAPLDKLQQLLSRKDDEAEILKGEVQDLEEAQHMGMHKNSRPVRPLADASESQAQQAELDKLKARHRGKLEELDAISSRHALEVVKVRSQAASEFRHIGEQVINELKQVSGKLETITSDQLPAQHTETAQLLNQLMINRQQRALKDIANHALVVEQSAIAPLSMGIIHYKRHREIQEVITTFINDEAKHSATFRRYLAEKLDAREYISEKLIKGAEGYMWLARFFPRPGMFMAVIVEAIGAASLEFFGKNEYMPEKLFQHICQVISEQDEVRHLDLCVSIYNELYHTGSWWEKFQNEKILTGMLKAVYGDKTDDHPLLKAFRVFGVPSEALYQLVMSRVSEQLARIGFFVTPERLLGIIGKK